LLQSTIDPGQSKANHTDSEGRHLTSEAANEGRLRRTMGFRDVVLFYVAAVLSPRWIATAAAVGPSALVIWGIVLIALFIPLAFCVIELSSRYPEEGGVYVWSKRAFGDFAGFITGWSYWTSNLPYFPAVLYFAAGSALFIDTDRWQALSHSGSYYIGFSLLGLLLAAALNIIGLDIGKWLHNIGAFATWIPLAILIVMGIVAGIRFGPATEFDVASLIPSTRLQDVIFWSTIAFAFGGLEAASTMSAEIENARRAIPRAILVAGIIIAGLYILGTLSTLLALPQNEVSGLQGITQAITKTGARVGFQLGPLAALLLTVSNLGAVGAWFAATARLPFVAGIDRFLPSAFGRLHPRWNTPHVALITQAVIAAVFIVLGQAGTTVKGAYDILVSASVISYFIPFLFMFAALIKLQSEPAGAEVLRVPGGATVAVAVAAVGFATTAVSIVLAMVPSEQEVTKTLAVLKIAGLSLLPLVLGIVTYAAGKRKKSVRG
jgi:glutamate:GABA antiporter